MIHGCSNFNPLDVLKEYNNHKNMMDFETNAHECEIRFNQYSGKDCEKMSPCCDLFCRYWLITFLTIRIDDRNISNIECPTTDSTVHVHSDQIKRLCPTNLFDSYEKYLLEYEPLRIGRILNYPRKQCQSLVTLDQEKNR